LATFLEKRSHFPDQFQTLTTKEEGLLMTNHIPVSIDECSQVGDKSEDVEFILNQLTEGELEIAARTAYAYTQDSSRDNCKRKLYASHMAQRYLNSKSDSDKALQFMKATIQFRKDVDIDNLIPAAKDPRSDYHILLSKFLYTKQSFVQGYDKQGRSTYVFVPRLVQDHDPEWTRKGHVWSMERAIACSKSPDQTVNCVVDFRGFSALSHAPPTTIGKDIMLTLRNHYVGHVHRILLIDAPAAFLWLWAILKHFAGSKTRDKIQFINSDEEKEAIIGELYDAEQATSWMLPNGKKDRELDLDEYLKEIPFDQAFDE
jgi:CRAL/TRIO domain